MQQGRISALCMVIYTKQKGNQDRATYLSSWSRKWSESESSAALAHTSHGENTLVRFICTYTLCMRVMVSPFSMMRPSCLRSSLFMSTWEQTRDWEKDNTSKRCSGTPAALGVYAIFMFVLVVVILCLEADPAEMHAATTTTST